MLAEEVVFSSLPAALTGIVATVSLESLLRPRPAFSRPWSAWALHVGVMSVIVGMLMVLVGNSWLAAGFLVVIFLILVLVNNAKVASLDEPFVFQDYEYFTDMIRYPRLYIPFFGWRNFLVSVASGLVLLYFAVTEAGPLLHLDWRGSLLGGGAVAVFGLACMWAAGKSPLVMSFDPQKDLRTFGFVACLWRYGVSSRKLPAVTSPFEGLETTSGRAVHGVQGSLPHMVAVQSESFFDPRQLYPGIRTSLLAEYDRIKSESYAWGALRVPAWGANTIRTEFSFLSGIEHSLLDVHRFNPYRALARGWNVMTLAAFLRSRGYRTICVHPYSKSFYLRDKVLPRMAFDAFWGIECFANARRFGPYVSDASVADKIIETLKSASQPTFVFAITMENHGPLHLEKLKPEDAEQLYSVPPSGSSDDLTVYLRHIRNADAMIGMLTKGAEMCERPVELCWYGDHVPIMPKVYAAYGTPCGDVEYVLWRSRSTTAVKPQDIAADQMALIWLKHIGLISR